MTLEKVNDVLKRVLRDTYLEANPIETIDTAFYPMWGLDARNIDPIRFFSRIEGKLASLKRPDPEILEAMVEAGRKVIPFSLKETAWRRLAKDTAESGIEIVRKEGKINMLILYAGFAYYKLGKVNFVEEIRNSFYSVFMENDLDPKKYFDNSLITILDIDSKATEYAKEQLLQYFPNINIETLNAYDIVGLKRLLKDMGRMEFYHLVVNTSLFGKHPFSNQFYRAISMLLKPGHFFLSANSHHALWKSPHIFIRLIERIQGADVELFRREILSQVEPPEELFTNEEEELQTEIAIAYYENLNEKFREISENRGVKIKAPNRLLDSTTTISQKMKHMRSAFFSIRMIPLVKVHWKDKDITFMYAMEGQRKETKET